MTIILSACVRPAEKTAAPALDDSGDISVTGETQQANPTSAEVPTSQETIEQSIPDLPSFGYTYHKPDGNRLVSGAGAMPVLEPLKIPL